MSLKILLLFTLAFVLLLKVDAQSKSKTKTQTKKEEVKPPLPPPPGVEMREATPAEIAEAQKKADEEMMNPQIDFDTTAAPDDLFTRNIMKLLEVTQAINMGTNIAQNMQTEQNEMMTEFYARFIKDMREGTARRWLERIYVKEYRTRFTNEEVEELLKFYDSPLGKKTIKETADMLPGVMAEGKKLGAYIGVKIYSQLLDEQKKN